MAVAGNDAHLVVADQVRLTQVIANLVNNAVKFTMSGHVLVTVDQRSAGEAVSLKVSVKDTGVGIPDEQHANIFSDFFQADSSKARRHDGTGLGLAISRRLIEAMGGHVVSFGRRQWFDFLV